jgi:hypothetical protein
MTEQQLLFLDRLGKSMEGRDLVEEILQPLLRENHQQLLNSTKEFRDELVGYGNCLNYMIELITKAADKLNRSKEVEAPDRL